MNTSTARPSHPRRTRNAKRRPALARQGRPDILPPPAELPALAMHDFLVPNPRPDLTPSLPLSTP